MTILVTGAAGFIGAALSQYLLDRGDDVVGVDNLNDYYDVNLKKARLESLITFNRFAFNQLDISDRSLVAELFSTRKFSVVVNLAAQAGVRYSIDNPSAYIVTNLVGFGNILEGCRHQGIDHLVYASSSSVYGSNTKLPFSEADVVDQPISLYAATKKANELMAHVYSHLYGLPTTGLRFFTVYGPWGRPDMAAWLFTKAILAGQPITVFNHGHMMRDFTYVDDITAGVIAVLDNPPAEEIDGVPHRLYNIGNNRSEKLMDFIAVLEDAIGIKAEMEFAPLQPGDVKETYADISAIQRDTGFSPTTTIADGVPRFVDWYRTYHGN